MKYSLEIWTKWIRDMSHAHVTGTNGRHWPCSVWWSSIVLTTQQLHCTVLHCFYSLTIQRRAGAVWDGTVTDWAVFGWYIEEEQFWMVQWVTCWAVLGGTVSNWFWVVQWETAVSGGTVSIKHAERFLVVQWVSDRFWVVQWLIGLLWKYCQLPTAHVCILHPPSISWPSFYDQQLKNLTLNEILFGWRSRNKTPCLKINGRRTLATPCLCQGRGGRLQARET